jgi:hypothetical protein
MSAPSDLVSLSKLPHLFSLPACIYLGLVPVLEALQPIEAPPLSLYGKLDCAKEYREAMEPDLGKHALDITFSAY